MKIGIDLDEITANLLDQFHKFYHKKTGKLFHKKDIKTSNWGESWGIFDKKEQFKIIKEFHDSDFYDEIEPIERAIESINHLIDNNEIYIITSRPTIFKEKTEGWIKKHLQNLPINIIYTKDFFNEKGKSKSDICNRLGIKIIIEDDKDYALDCANSNIRVILFDKPWNQDCHHKNLHRVNNWDEAVKKINSIIEKA